MTDETLDKYKEILRGLDSTSLEERAKRFKELGTIITDSQKGPPSFRMDPYQKEATNSYINGNFRSCIFSCACIVDQVFKHEYVKASENKKKALEDIEGKTFGDAIGLVRKLSKDGKLGHLKPFIDKAETLNNIRNKISVHPGYVDLPPSSDWGLRIKLIKKDICILLKLLVKTNPQIKPEERKKMFEKTLDGIKFNLGAGDPQPQVVTLRELLDRNFEVEGGLMAPDVTREVIEESFLSPLALRSYKFMKEIVEGIYGVQKHG